MEIVYMYDDNFPCCFVIKKYLMTSMDGFFIFDHEAAWNLF